MATEIATKFKRNPWEIFHTLMTIFFIFGFRYIPAPEPLTPAGMTIFGIFLGLIYGLSTVGGIWPSLLAIIAVPLTGSATIGATLASGLGLDSNFMMLYMMIFAALLTENNVTKVLTFWIMSQKFLQGRPWLFSFFLLYGMFLIGSIGATFGVIIIFWSMVTTICSESGIKPYEKWPTLMIFGVTLAALFTSSMWMFRGNPLFLSQAYKQASGIEISMFTYSFFNFILATIVVICFIIICKYLFKVDVSKIKNIDSSFIKPEELVLDRKQKFLLLTFFGILATIMGTGFMPASWPITQVLSRIGNSSIVGLWMVMLFIVHFDGKPVLDFKAMAAKGVMWDVWFLSGAVLSVAGLMLGEGMGIKEFLMKIVGPILTGQGYIVFTILVVLIATILTNIVANTVIGLLFVPIIYSCSAQMGIDGTPVLVLMLVCIHLAILTPGASPFAAMLFGNGDWVKPKDVYLYGGISVIVILMILLIIGIPLVNILF